MVVTSLACRQSYKPHQNVHVSKLDELLKRSHAQPVPGKTPLAQQYTDLADAVAAHSMSSRSMRVAAVS